MVDITSSNLVPVMPRRNFAPRGWAFCDGQLLAINANQALFSILGTTYGGDGRTSFALPDFRGRVPIGQGTDSLSGTDYNLGQKGGAETHVLTITQMPSHTHDAALHAMNTTQARDSSDPAGASLGGSSTCDGNYVSGTSGNPVQDDFIAMQGVEIGNTGGNQAHQNMAPFQAVNYIIALSGIFPSRS
eukprot:81891-Rhodomonas_salina.1